MIEDVKRIPYGVSNFVEVVEQNQYYVDKTMLSASRWNSSPTVYSLSAPGVSAKVSS